MTREEAISVLENPDVNIGVVARIGQDPEYWRKLKPALDMAISALRQQDVTDTNVGNNEPLTLDELVEFGVRSENGENIIVYCTPLNDWAKVFKFGLLFFGTEDYRSWPEIEADYSKTWLAYRQKPEEVQK